MRYLRYTNYQSGESGLSNGIMSIEVGAVLAFLTNRFLLLEGNRSPPANVVSYGDRVDNSVPSRVTDLIDIPVAWSNVEDIDTSSLASAELSDKHLGSSVFYLPGTVDPQSLDAQSFANGRENWLSATGRFEDVPVLSVSEDRDCENPRLNLTYYSYFFYLDAQTRRSVYQMLTRMQAKRELAELASKVAGDIGSFNAVHLRRGDFKVTYGVTTLDRQPWEAIEALDNHFNRDDTLVIVTDERSDPFFDEIKAAYPHHIFIDHHILDEYRSDFDALPHRDSIALAYLSQLVAADSQDFIGSMTSTFTAIIQRYRGNRGKREPFKFLWNELPDQGDRLERGRHPVSECIPLDHGVMIEESSGPYSWNRYSSRIAANWMREWPEAFLTDEALESGSVEKNPAPAARSLVQLRPQSSEILVEFEGLGIQLSCHVPRITTRLCEAFGVRAGNDKARNVISRMRIDEQDKEFALETDGREVVGAKSFEALAREIKREIVTVLALARRRHVWLNGFSFLRSGRAVVIVGDLGSEADWLPDGMCGHGWELLWDDVVPIRVDDLTVTPFGRSTWPKGAALRIDRHPYPLAGLIVANRQLHRRDEISVLSPSVGVAELIGACVDFPIDRIRAVERLCSLVEKRSVGLLSYSESQRGAATLTEPFVQAERDAYEQRNQPAPAPSLNPPPPAPTEKRSRKKKAAAKTTVRKSAQKKKTGTRKTQGRKRTV